MKRDSSLICRRAAAEDLEAVGRLLVEVNQVHADLRPDLFLPGARKYGPEELAAIFADDSSPVFVALRGGDLVGHAFCRLERHGGNMREHLSLYIDDICVASGARGTGAARLLFEHARGHARELGCHNITLNVWEGNGPALGFYEHMGLCVQKRCMELVLDREA